MYAVLDRTRLLFRLCLVVLGCLALNPVFAITKGDMGQFRYNKSGSTISIYPNQSGYSGSLASISPFSSAKTQTGQQIGQSGWYYGTGAASNPATGGTMILGHYGDVYFAGTKYPFQAGYQVPVSALTNALGMLCTNPLVCMAISLATPTIADWLTTSGVGINQDPATMNNKPWTMEKKKYLVGCNSGVNPDWGLEGAGCFGQYGGVVIVIDSIEMQGNTCVATVHCSNGSNQGTKWRWPVDRSEYAEREPATLDEIRPVMKFPTDPAGLVRDLLDKGADIELERPTVTGPSEITGPTTTTKNPDGTTTTSTDKSNFKTSDNTITQVGTGNTTQKCDPTSGKCDTTTTDQTDPNSADKQKALCEQYPDILACAIADTPKADIPKDSKEISYTPENIFGSGSCPSDRYLTLHNGQNLKVWDWQNACQKIVDCRPLVIALGGFAALMVLVPGLKGDLV